jgi:hypothetical protein
VPGGVVVGVGVRGVAGGGGIGEELVVAKVGVGERGAASAANAGVDGDSGNEVDMLGEAELPTPSSKWMYSTVKSSYAGVEPSSTALFHAHHHPSLNTTSCALRTRCVFGSRMR